MLHPGGHGENRARLEKSADLQFFRGRICDPRLAVVRDLERWDILVSIPFVYLKRDRAVPFLPPHGENLFRRERVERYLPEEKEVGFAA